MPVLATDIDARSVAVARDNARLNGVGAFVTAIHAADLRAPEIARRAPFDLVMSNILLRPLQRLAAPMARQLVPNARVVLSGVLKSQANAALSAYRSQGLMLERSFPLDGWFTPLHGGAGRLTAADHVVRMAHLPFRQGVEQTQQCAAPRIGVR